MLSQYHVMYACPRDTPPRDTPLLHIIGTSTLNFACYLQCVQAGDSDRLLIVGVSVQLMHHPGHKCTCIQHARSMHMHVQHATWMYIHVSSATNKLARILNSGPTRGRRRSQCLTYGHKSARRSQIQRILIK